MNKKEIIKKTAEFAERELSGETTGHDWFHTYRVWQLAKKINKKEGGDSFTIGISALLHDVADRKLNDNSAEKGIVKVNDFLSTLNLSKDIVNDVIFNIKYISFSSRKPKKETIELKILQDADRIDALGAIGIARVFAYGGKHGKEIYNPNIKVPKTIIMEDYLNNKGTSVNHFYEKILKLVDMMNTKTGKKIAKSRHDFVKIYLKEFFKEWEVKL